MHAGRGIIVKRFNLTARGYGAENQLNKPVPQAFFVEGNVREQSEMYEMGMLMDFYGSLLTENTLEVMNLYYSEDMSLAEIGETLGISRQGAHSFITKGKQQLLEFEEKLGMFSRYKKNRAMLEEIQTECEIIDSSSLSKYEAEVLANIKKHITDLIAEL